jgi:hypothetical protein
MADFAGPWNLGFLTVLNDPAGYLGGYLVTNQWGRPIEFRLSTAVQPNRVQQILYGPTLQTYVCGELIGKTLVEKTAAQVRMIVTDTQAVLDLRQRVHLPVAFLNGEQQLLPHPQHLNDTSTIQRIQEELGNGLELGEPFVRVREAIAEARKMGVTNRA